MNRENFIYPYSEEAECSLIGSILIEPGLFCKVNDIIIINDFYVSLYRNIYSSFSSLYKNNQEINIVSVLDYLKKHGVNIKSQDLMSIINNTQSSSFLSEYANIVKEKSNQRKTINEILKITDHLSINSYDVEEPLLELKKNLESIGKKDKFEIFNFSESMNEIVEELEKRLKEYQDGSPSPFGLSKLDKYTCGVKKQCLTIIAGLSSVGKTSFATQVAFNLAKRNFKVLYLSGEMPEKDLRDRMICNELSIDHFSFQKGYVAHNDVPRINEFIKNNKIDLKIIFNPILNLSFISNVVEKYRPDFVFVDYIQMVQFNNRNENRARELADFCYALKSLSQKYDNGMILLSQMTEHDGKKDHGPSSFSMKESNGIMEASDVAIMLHNKVKVGFDAVGEADSETRDVYLSIKKQRNGPTGTMIVRFYKKFIRFVDIEGDNNE